MLEALLFVTTLQLEKRASHLTWLLQVRGAGGGGSPSHLSTQHEGLPTSTYSLYYTFTVVRLPCTHISSSTADDEGMPWGPGNSTLQNLITLTVTPTPGQTSSQTLTHAHKH